MKKVFYSILNALIWMAIMVFAVISNKAHAQCPTPAGNQIAAGENSWIGYVYAQTDAANPPTNPFGAIYRGYLTHSLIFDQDLGTTELSAPDLCGTYQEHYAIRFKATHSFPSGYYAFTVGGDDGYRLSLDGGNTFVLSNWSDHTYTQSSAVYYLSGNLELVLEYYQSTDASRIQFSYTPCSAPSEAPAQIDGNASVCSGTALVLTATGGFAAPGATYEWGTGTVAGTNGIPGATTSSITVYPTGNVSYWVRRVDSGSCASVSGAATKSVQVFAPSAVDAAITAPASVCSGFPAVLGTSGYTGSLQWQTSSDEVTWTTIPGATSATYQTENLSVSRFYRVQALNGICDPAYSNSHYLVVNPPSVAGTASGAATVCAGTNTTSLSLSGQTGTVQWQASADNLTFTDISGATSATYVATNLSATTYYRAKVTSGACEPAYSNSVNVVVTPAPVAGTITASAASVCAGTNSTTLTLSGYTGSIQWESSLNNVSFSPIPGATSATYQAINIAATTYFRVRVSTAGCASVAGSGFALTVAQQPVAGTISGSGTVCSGTNSTTLTASGYTGSVQWQESVDASSFSDIVAATSATYTATNLTATKYYRVKVSSGSCAVVYGPAVSVVVSAQSVSGTASGTATICSVTNSTIISLSGNVGNVQWQSSTDNVSFTDISGATSASYTATNISATQYYRARVTNGACPAATSAVVTLTFAAAVPGTISGATTVCTGSNSTVLTVSGYSGTLQWQRSSDNATFTDIASATASTYSVTNISAATYYRVKATTAGCGSTFSPSVLMSVNANTNGGTAAITNQSVTTITVPSTYNSTVFTVSGYSGTAIQWQSSTDNVTFSNISGATSTSYTATNVAVTTYFRAAVSTGACVGYSNVLTLQTCVPTGTQTQYGTGNTWRTYFYAQHDGANPPVTPFGTYQGYFTTGAFAFDNYPYNNMASTVCTALWANFKGAYRYRLTKNFTAGNYMFMLGSNGGYRMSLDGGSTWIINHWTSSGTFNSEDSAWMYLSGNMNIVIEFFHLSTYNPRHYFNYCSDVDSTSVTAPTSVLANDIICLGGNATILAKGGNGSSYQWGTGTTPGSNIISGQTGSSIIVAPTATTTYWVRRYNPVCETYTAALTQTITVNPLLSPTPNGNTTDYGDGTWIGYVYASKNGSTSNPALAFGGTGSNYAYMGYVTTASDTFSHTGGVWNSPNNPISGPNVCSSYYSNFAIRYKMRKTFTPGYYNFTITADDGMRFSVDGGVTWAVSRWGYVTNGLTNTYSVFLSGLKDLVIEYTQASSTAQITFSYTSCTNYSTAPTAISGTTAICAGSSTTLTATGGTVAANTTYEWGTGSVVGTNVLAFTTQSITVTPAANTTYWVRRKNGGLCQETVGANTAGAYTAGVTANITISSLSVAGTVSGGNVTVCAGTNSTAFTLSGQTGSIQWQSSADNATWTDIASANATTYTATNLSATAYYRAKITNGACSEVFTNVRSVTVIPASVAGTVSGNTSVCTGQNSATVSLSGYTGTIQWQVSADNSNWSNISGATSASYAAVNLTATTYYRAVVTSGSCSAATSGVATVTVVSLPVAGSVSGSSVVCSGSNSTVLTASGYSGSLQWQQSTDNSSFTDITSATVATYTAANLSGTRYYRVRVSNGSCTPVYSPSASVTVNPTPLAGTISGPSALCAGSNSAALSVSGSQGSIQWQSSLDNVTFTDIPGATSAGYTAYNLTANTYFRVRTTNGPCSATSASAFYVAVNPVPVAGTLSGAATVCSGTNSTTLTLSGQSGSIQWKSSADNATFTDVPGAVAASLVVNNLNATTYYKAFVSNSPCATVSTASVAIHVVPASVAGTASGAVSLCAGDNQATLTLSGNTGSIQWESSPDNVSFSAISGATAATFTAYNLSATRYYRAVSTSNDCTPAVSNTVAVQVYPTAQAGTVNMAGTNLPSMSVCSGTNSTVLQSIGSTGDVQWQSSLDNVTFTDVAGATSANYTAAGLLQSTYFRALITSGCGSSQTSASVFLNVPTAAVYDGMWSANPSTTSTIIVEQDLTLSSGLNVCSCLVKDASVMKINAGVTLISQKSVVVEEGSQLIIESNGSLVQVDDAAVNSGIATVRRNSTSMKPYDYGYWSSPVNGMTLHDLSPNTLSDKYYFFNPDSNNWNSIVGGDAEMAAGTGYIVRTPQGWTTGIFTGEFNGVLNNGIIPVQVKQSLSAYNLIGNPYPSAIDIDRFLTDPANENLVKGTIYLWTHNTAIAPSGPYYVYTANDYAKYNLTGGVRTAEAAITGGPVPSGKIASGQAFFIEAQMTGDVTFRNAMRITGSNTQFFRQAQAEEVLEQPEKNRIWLDITNAQGAFDEALVGYIQGATNAVDSKFDGAVFPAGNVVSLYSLAGSGKYAIQGRALPFDADDVVPMGYKSTIATNFTISLFDADGLFADAENVQIYLLDKSDNSYHDLREASYTFATVAGTFDDRFEIHYETTALGTAGHTISDAFVSGKDGEITVSTAGTQIRAVQVFDVTGKRIFQAAGLSEQLYGSGDLNAATQVVLVKVLLENGVTVTKKVILD